MSVMERSLESFVGLLRGALSDHKAMVGVSRADSYLNNALGPVLMPGLCEILPNWRFRAA